MLGMKSKLPPHNLMEVHLRDLPEPKVELTYLGVKKVVESKPLWDFIVSCREAWMVGYMEQLSKELAP